MDQQPTAGALWNGPVTLICHYVRSGHG